MRIFYKEINGQVFGYLLSQDLSKLYDLWESSISVINKLLDENKIKAFDKQKMILIPMYAKEFVENYVSATYYQVKTKF